MSRKTRGVLNLVPIPQTVKLIPGTTVLRAGPVIEPRHPGDPRERLAAEMIRERLGGTTKKRGGLKVRIGSLATFGKEQNWLDEDQVEFLRNAESDQAYVLQVNRRGITIVGKTSLGALYGTQTLLQLVERKGEGRSVKNLEIRDFPAVENRYIAIAMSWY